MKMFCRSLLSNSPCKSIKKLMRHSYLFSLKLSLPTSENTVFDVTGTDFILVDCKNAFGVAKFDRAAVQNIAVFVRFHEIRHRLRYAYCIRVMHLHGRSLVHQLSGRITRASRVNESYTPDFVLRELYNVRIVIYLTY